MPSKKQQVNLVMEPKLRKQIGEMAKSLDMSVSALVRVAVRQYVEQFKKEQEA